MQYWWRLLWGTFIQNNFKFRPVVEEQVCFRSLSIFSSTGHFVWGITFCTTLVGGIMGKIPVKLV